MAAQWIEHDSKVNDRNPFNEEPSMQLFGSEETKSASRKTLSNLSHNPSPRSEEPPSEIMLMSNTPSPTSPLPQYKVHTPFYISYSRIIDAFEKSSTAKNFQVIEKGGNIATAVHKDKIGLRDVLLCCFPHSSGRGMTAVRMHIGVNEKKCTRTILLKGIYGSADIIQSFLNAFKSRIEPLLNQTFDSQSPSGLRSSDFQYEHLTSEKLLDDDEGGLTIKNESASYYQFHKILSSESYTLGQTIANFVSSFSAQYRNVEESSVLLPQPVRYNQMESVKLLIEETVEALFSHFNFGKANTERMMHFCRPAVEKFVFAKLLPHISSIYRFKFRELDESFQTKRQLLNAFPIRELMAQLEVTFPQVKEKLRLTDLQAPYKEAIEVLAKLKDFSTPVEKLNCLLTSVAAMKTAVVDYWHGKEELEAMDDMLPVLILVLVSSTVESPAAEVCMLQDYIGQATRYENESQLLTNFEVSVRYIAQEWKLPRTES